MDTLLHVKVPHSFSLARAVCSYGFFMTQPNFWRAEEEPSSSSGKEEQCKGVLERPLRLDDGRAVVTCVWEEQEQLSISVRGVDHLDSEDRQAILSQVKRMLRLSNEEDTVVDAFHALHPEAREDGFGRLFRSPTLFEDMVKSILLCNCSWPRTLLMSRALCELQFELKGPPIGYSNSTTSQPVKVSRHTPKKRPSVASKSVSRSTVRKLQNKFTERMETAVESSEVAETLEEEAEYVELHIGAFPTAEELASLDEEFLAKRCGLGYRTKMVLRMAQDVASGRLELSRFEGPEALQGEALRDAILKVYGFGPFCGANVMMLLGNYNVIPADSETLRHLKQFHGKQDVTKQNITTVVANMYEKYKPFEFLAYWWEIWRTYEERFGDFTRLSAAEFRRITGLNMKKLSTA